jgi:phage shock protein PspC (stress-responsive transcriptional regulator)
MEDTHKIEKIMKRKGMVIIMGNDMKKLVRSKANRMVCGVCGGIGEYLNVDPTIVRLVWVVVSLLSCGTGLLAYLIAAIVVPEDNDIIG